MNTDTDTDSNKSHNIDENYTKKKDMLFDPVHKLWRFIYSQLKSEIIKVHQWNK